MRSEANDTGRRGASGGSSLSRRVLKVMAMFTGMQALNIICSIVKMKLVALWLQATGVGIFGILSTTTDTISTLTDLGLRQSAVRDVAANAGRPSLLARTAAVVRRWSMLTGLLGAVVVSGLCVPLSIGFFGVADRWWMFAVLSGAMLLNAVAGGEQALLQGSGRLRDLLRATSWSAVGGLLISIPLFRWCGVRGVAWSFVAYAACGLALVLVWRLRTPRTEVSGRETIRLGGGFMRLGMWLAAAAFVTNLSQMAFLAFLTKRGSAAETGLYQGGVTLVVRYIGLIFTAMAMEYYPRLAANASSRLRTRLFVNHEAAVLLTVLAPVTVVFLLLRGEFVRLFYSSAFLPMLPFVSWTLLSSVFRALSWSQAFVILARGDGRIYMITESLDAAVGLGLCIGAYSLWGLTGVGVAYIAWYGIYTLMTGAVCRRRYGIMLSGTVLRLGALVFMTGAGMLAAVHYLPAWGAVAVGVPVALSFLPGILRLWRR